MTKKYFIGVDVGTSSVRASVVNEAGECCFSSTQEIMIWNPDIDIYQQSSDNIWEGVSYTVQVSSGTVKALF